MSNEQVELNGEEIGTVDQAIGNEAEAAAVQADAAQGEAPVAEFKPVVLVRGTEYAFSYTAEDTDKFTKKYHICVDGELVKAFEQSAYFKTKGRYTVPGFRKGKATMASIKHAYGEGCFMQAAFDEAIDEIYRVMYRPVFVKGGIAAAPDVAIESFDDGCFKFAYIIVSYAKAENLIYKDLLVHFTKAEKYVEDIAKQKLEAAQNKAGYWQDITDRALALNDTANIDYEGKLNGVAFEGGTAQGHDLEIGSGSFIPGFEDQLIGMNIGETKDITVTFPEQYNSDELAGNEAVFTVKLNSAKVKVTPVADDEFAKDVSEFDTIEQLLASYNAEAQIEAEQRAHDSNYNTLLSAVLDANEYELPPAAITELVDKKMQGFEQQLAGAKLTFEQYEQYSGITREAMRERFQTEAAANEKRNILLSAIVEAENLQTEPEELEAKLAENAAKANKELEEYRKEVKRDELEYMLSDILFEKLCSRLAELNTVVYD